MDQSKWSLPRARHARLTKAEAPLLVKIQGVWFLAFKSGISHFHLRSTPALLMLLLGFCGRLRIHNVALRSRVLSPLVRSDASTIVETLARSVEAATSQFRSLGKAVPKQTLVWALLAVS